MCNTWYYTWRQHVKCNKISIKVYKNLVQQKVQQNVHNNYVALLIQQFGFNKLVELYFPPTQQNQNTKKIQFFNKFYCATRFAFRCAALCSVMNFAVKFHLKARENKFRIVIYPRVHFIMICIFKFYIFE